MILAISSTKNIGMLKLYLSFDNLKLLISSFSFHYLYINTGIIMRLPNQKLAISNLALIAYYVLPNFTTFALVLLFIGLTLSSQIFTNILQI